MASTVPSTPPIAARTRLSVMNCRTIRPRLAPTARRTATSRCRAVPRASSRLATFAHTISSTAPTAIVITRSAGRLAAIDLFLDAFDREAPNTGGKRSGERSRRGLRTQAFADRVGLVGRRFHGRAGLQTGDDAAAQSFPGRRALGDRCPVVRVGNREVEVCRHHADDRQRRSVEESGFRAKRLERDGAPENVRVALKVSLPRAGADDDDVRAGRFVRGVENAAEPRARTEHREGIRRHQRAGQAARSPPERRHQRDRRRDRERHLRQRRSWSSATSVNLGPATCRVLRRSGALGSAGAARSTIRTS